MFARIKPLGWGFQELLTSGQMTQLDIDHANAVDGVGGGDYAGPVGFSNLQNSKVTGYLEVGNSAVATKNPGVLYVGDRGIACDNGIAVGGYVGIAGVHPDLGWGLMVTQRAEFHGALVGDGANLQLSQTGELLNVMDSSRFVGADHQFEGGITIAGGGRIVGGSTVAIDPGSKLLNHGLIQNESGGSTAIRIVQGPDADADITIAMGDIITVDPSANRLYRVRNVGAVDGNTMRITVADANIIHSGNNLDVARDDGVTNLGPPSGGLRFASGHAVWVDIVFRSSDGQWHRTAWGNYD